MIQEEVRSVLYQRKPDRNSDSDMQIRTKYSAAKQTKDDQSLEKKMVRALKLIPPHWVREIYREQFTLR